MSDELLIAPDIPVSAPAFGFQHYATALAEVIASGSPAQFTVGIFGPWGTGKSSLLRALLDRLSSNESVLPVYFDAWRYERAGHLIVPLLHAVATQVEERGEKSLARSVRQTLKAVGFALSFQLPVVGVGFSPRDALKAWESDEEADRIPLDEAFAEPFSRLRSIGDAVGDKRIVVLIDDLDRCSPDQVVSVIEAINLITDIPGFVFVLALDYDILVKAIEVRYRYVDGRDFIQKIVQIPFRIPRLIRTDDSVLEQLLPQWDLWSARFPELTSIVEDLAFTVLDANPRQIKRLLNAFSLVNRIVELRSETVRPAVLASVLAGELRWPDAFSDLRTAVSSGDDNPLSTLDDPDDDQFSAFVSQYLISISVTELETILSLTAAVVVDEAPEAPPPDAPLSVDRGRDLLTEQLPLTGWLRSSRGYRNQIYYHAEHPNLRFMITKLVARFEARRRRIQGRPWVLVESFRLRTEAEKVLAVARDPQRYAPSGE